MKRVLLTGAAGDVGQRLRPLLKSIYPELILSDRHRPEGLAADDRFVSASLDVAQEIERACQGVDGIVHMGGRSTEADWDVVLPANIAGAINLFEAARKCGVKRVVFASSNHVVGFYPRAQTIGHEVVALPDTRYGVSKLFGEGLGAYYAYKHGIGVTSLRIGSVSDTPLNERRLSIWLSPTDLVQLIRIGLEHPGIVYETLYGVSDNVRSWYDNSRAYELGYRPQGRAEDHVEAAMAAERDVERLPADAYFQGGSFAQDGFTADLEALKLRK